MTIENLCQIIAVSGDEKDMHDYLQTAYTTLGYPVVKDKLGSLFAKVSGKTTERLMISANMDENGGMICDIDEDGLLQFLVVGTYAKSVFANQRVIVLNRRHQHIEGIVVEKANEYVIDVGACSREEVAKKAIQIGDMVALDIRTRETDTEITSKNLNNRIGLAIGLGILEHFTTMTPHYETYIGGIAHSVTGQRGANTATHVVKPDIACIIDASYVPNYKENTLYIRRFDKTMLPNIDLVYRIETIAKKLGYDVSGQTQLDGTDGSFIHKSLTGAPSVVLVLPLKHPQAALNSVRKKDILLLQHVLTAMATENMLLDDAQGEGL